jgi:hypothetical protein
MPSTRTLIWIAGLAGLAAGIRLSTRRQREREPAAPLAPPQSLQAWEGEGGAVPVRGGRTAQQVSPMPQGWPADASTRAPGEDASLPAGAPGAVH